MSKLIYPSGGYVRYVWGLTSTVFDAVSWEGIFQGGGAPAQPLMRISFYKQICQL